MQQLIIGNYLCHMKCKMVHSVLVVAQLARQHLQDYDTVPALGNGNGMLLKPFCFRIGVKTTAPLCSTHKVVAVSVSIPMDAMGNRVEMDGVTADNLPDTIEIMLVDIDGKTVESHPLMVSEIHRFGSVAELMLFLDKLANDKRSPKIGDEASADEESADDEEFADGYNVM